MYWIGGSPCAGKSSVAALLAARHGLRHVECDAGADARLARMAGHGLPAYTELSALSTRDRLRRPPAWQAERELAFYAEQWPFLRAELPAGPCVVEGADLLPSLLAAAGVPPGNAVWLVPTREFQLRHYAARDWVADYLRDCDAGAFDAWMRRDMLFAEHVRATAEARGGTVLVVDGSATLEQSARRVERHFGLARTGGTLGA